MESRGTNRVIVPVQEEGVSKMVLSCESLHLLTVVNESLPDLGHDAIGLKVVHINLLEHVLRMGIYLHNKGE